MYVVHRNILSDSFWIRIVWFQPKQDSDRISFFKNRIGSDSKNLLSDHLWCGICMTFIEAESNRSRITCIMVVAVADCMRFQNLPNRIRCGVKKKQSPHTPAVYRFCRGMFYYEPRIYWKSLKFSSGLPVWFCWGQICNFWTFFNSFGSFFVFKKRPNEILLFLAVFGEFDFLCRFGRFYEDIGWFLGTGRFLDTNSGYRMINFQWKLCTGIYNLGFAVSCLLIHRFAAEMSGVTFFRFRLCFCSTL